MYAVTLSDKQDEQNLMRFDKVTKLTRTQKQKSLLMCVRVYVHVCVYACVCVLVCIYACVRSNEIQIRSFPLRVLTAGFPTLFRRKSVLIHLDYDRLYARTIFDKPAYGSMSQIWLMSLQKRMRGHACTHRCVRVYMCVCVTWWTVLRSGDVKLALCHV